MADAAIEELKQLMNCDPAHGAFYQRMMAVMMYRKCQAMEAIELRDEQKETTSS